MSDMVAQLIERVQQSLSEKTPLRIEGGNTKVFMGRAAALEVDNVLSLAAHHGIVNYEPVELIMTARAGTSLAEIDAVLAENNQVLACDPARFSGKATIAGSLACNQSGPARPWTGSLRDHVLGIKLINGKGEHLNFGGRVMKNVAGYDVSRLQAGAMGAYGVITEVSFKVLPKPALEKTLVLEADVNQAIDLMNSLSGLSKPVNGAAWLDNTLYLRLSGAQSAVTGTLAQWQKQYQKEYTVKILDDDEGQQFWTELRDRTLPFFTTNNNDSLSVAEGSLPAAEGSLWRCSLNAAAAPYQGEGNCLINWAGAERWVKDITTSAVQNELRPWVETAGGEVSLYQASDADKAFEMPVNPVLKKYHQNLKKALDPQGIFNPGRLYEWL